MSADALNVETVSQPSDRRAEEVDRPDEREGPDHDGSSADTPAEGPA